MTVAYDAAAWTGRTWHWRWIGTFSLRRRNLGLVAIRVDRDAQEGYRLPCYGFEIGDDPMWACRGWVLLWGFWERRFWQRSYIEIVEKGR